MNAAGILPELPGTCTEAELTEKRVISGDFSENC